MKVLITGSRHWTNEAAIKESMAQLLADAWSIGTHRDLVVIEGGCEGADRFARKAAHSIGVSVITVYAAWEHFGRSAGPIRNGWMLDLEPGMVFYFHNNLAQSKGTKDCVKQALQRDIRVYNGINGRELDKVRGLAL